MLQTYIIRYLSREETAGAFYKKELQIKKCLEHKKLIRVKVKNYMSNGKAIKDYNYSLNSWIDKKAQCK